MDKTIVIQNAKRIVERVGCDNPTVTYLNSVLRHDCYTHELSNGDTVMVDGGNSFGGGGYYARGCIFTVPEGTLVEEYTLTETSTFQEICDKLLWGTRGKLGNEKLHYVRLADCEIDHLKSILVTERHINPLHKSVVQYWKVRKDNNLF